MRGSFRSSRMTAGVCRITSYNVCYTKLLRPEPSKTLLAMGVAPELARNAVRVSVGRGTREADMTQFVQALAQEVRALRGLTAMAV